MLTKYETDDGGDNGAEGDTDDNGGNGAEEESQVEDVEKRDEEVKENKIMAVNTVDPDAWMDDATIPRNPTIEEDGTQVRATMDIKIPDETPISHVDETIITEPDDVAIQMESRY